MGPRDTRICINFLLSSKVEKEADHDGRKTLRTLIAMLCRRELSRGRDDAGWWCWCSGLASPSWILLAPVVQRRAKWARFLWKDESIAARWRREHARSRGSRADRPLTPATPRSQRICCAIARNVSIRFSCTVFYEFWLPHVLAYIHNFCCTWEENGLICDNEDDGTALC